MITPEASGLPFVSQNALEPLLKEVAAAIPHVTVRYGCELADFVQDETV